MTQFFAFTGFVALLILTTVILALILFWIGERADAKKRKKRRHHNTANLVSDDYFKVGDIVYECVDFEYYRGLVYVHGKPLEKQNYWSDATGRFLDEHEHEDGRSISIFDFGDITEILGRPTIK